MLDLLVRGRHLVFDTPLDRAELTSRLQREIAPPVRRWNEQRPQLFEGHLDGERFSMVRLVRGRNSFRPVIHGYLLPQPLGTTVKVMLRPHPAVLILSGCLAAVGCVVAGLLLQEWMQSGELPLPALPLLGPLALAGLGPVVLGSEARKATQLLETLFGVTARRSGEPPGRSSV